MMKKTGKERKGKEGVGRMEGNMETDWLILFTVRCNCELGFL
jgi:hypothetical protein